MFVLFDGSVFARTTDLPPVRLDRDVDFLNHIDAIESAVFGDWPTSAGNARYLVVPVSADGGSGALVAVIFSDLESAPIRDLLMRFALISVAALIGMSAIGYLVAGRVFRPISQLTRFVEEIEEEKLQGRIPVEASRNEINQLGVEFNRMLDRLEQAFASQREFVDVAGHELRTPLTVIRGHLDLMKHNPEEAKDSLAIVEDEIQRMSRLVTDLQTLTKSSNPKFVQAESVNLQDLSEELKAKISTLSERPIKVHDAQGFANLDKQRISQAIFQLVENALKYSAPEDKIEVIIQNEPTELKFIVDDSGPGVASDLRDSIWDPFVRGKQTQNIAGSGIGLSVVRAIARGHGGDVHVSESPVGGARFLIRIPK
jgi:signal transduction histidine kinase